jgi:hypothetical protein
MLKQNFWAGVGEMTTMKTADFLGTITRNILHRYSVNTYFTFWVTKLVRARSLVLRRPYVYYQNAFKNKLFYNSNIFWGKHSFIFLSVYCTLVIFTRHNHCEREKMSTPLGLNRKNFRYASAAKKHFTPNFKKKTIGLIFLKFFSKICLMSFKLTKFTVSRF